MFREHRLRRDHPDLESDSAGNLKPRQKYLSPPGRSNMLYVVPGIDPGLLHDRNIPVVVTEGEFQGARPLALGKPWFTSTAQVPAARPLRCLQLARNHWKNRWTGRQ